MMDEEKKQNAECSEEPPDAQSTGAADIAAENDTDEVRETRGEKKRVRKLESEIEALKKQLERAQSAADAANDKYMRMIAEYDNYRKRTAKEKENSYTDAYADAVVNILPVLDNLERASQYTDAEAVSKGISMTLKSFGETFEKLGIREIEAQGRTFDPNLHAAVMHVEDESYGENEIVEVLQKGYIKGDRVIRYAMVKVAN